MEQNPAPATDRAHAAPPCPATRTTRTRPTVWWTLRQIPGATEILERTGRLPPVLRFTAPQTIHAIRIPDGHAYHVRLPDGRHLLVTGGVYDIVPPLVVSAGDVIRLRPLEDVRHARPDRDIEEIPRAGADGDVEDAVEALIRATWGGQNAIAAAPWTLTPVASAATVSSMVAVQEEALGALDDGCLEPIEAPSAAPLALPEAATGVIGRVATVPRAPVFTFGLLQERRSGPLARLLVANVHREGTP